jgi:sugar lactone lactonase YvrE
VAGHAYLGSADGVGSSAQFFYPQGVVVDTNGNVYVADSLNQTIRKVTPAGVVSTLAGLAGVAGSADGSNGKARFYIPRRLALDTAMNLYVSDAFTIRRISTGGLVSTVAGLGYTSGTNDGTGSEARFNIPTGLTVDNAGTIYVADEYNHTIRQVTPAGVVTTIAGLAGVSGATDGPSSLARFNRPSGIAVATNGTLFVADTGNFAIRQITTAGEVSTVSDGTNGPLHLAGPQDVALDSAGSLYVSDTSNTVCKITLAGTNWVASTLAGNATIIVTNGDGSTGGGYADGVGTSARFSGPQGISVDRSGNVYVADTGNNTLRKITLAGVVRTLLGPPTSSGSADGTGPAARFNQPQGLALDSAGNLYVADTGNSTLRQITSAGVVSTLAGIAGNPGSADGAGSNAQFNRPQGVAVDTTGNVYVADTGNHMIRQISPAGVVSTIAGSTNAGGADGTGTNAQFYAPFGIALGQGGIYVADSQSGLRKLTLTGTDWVVSSLGFGYFGALCGISGDNQGNVYLAQPNNPFDTGTIYIFQDIPIVRSIRVFGLSYPTYSYPFVGIAVDKSGYAYMASFVDSVILKADLTNPFAYPSIGGWLTHPGSADGAGSAAQFYNPRGLALDNLGSLYVADTGNNTIRKGTFVAYAATNPVPYIRPTNDAQLVLTLLPPEANGQWRFPWELSWRNSGEAASNLVRTKYDVEFRAMPGWLAFPSGFSVQLDHSGLTSVTTNVYYPTATPAGAGGAAGSLTVYLGATPPSGAFWKIVGDTNQLASGFTTNLWPGTYLIQFAGPFTNRVTPQTAAVQISSGQSTVYSVNYLLSAFPGSGVLLPEPVPATNINNLGDYPFGFNGQLASDVGYGSGVAVQQNVVLTAAHLVFDDQNLSYVSQAYWFFQKEAGAFVPPGQLARGIYVLSDYASQRTNDLQSGLFAPDQSSPQSRSRDVAALYFSDYVAGGGYGGYLPSDAVPNSWLNSTSLKMLVGYPVDGSLFGDASIINGLMYQTDPQPYPLSMATDANVTNEQVYVAPWFLSYPGNSGGPFYVQFNGYYYPAGIYLGTLYSGTQPYASAVRAINSEVVNLIAAAQTDAGTGTNNTGGGVITIIPSQVSASNPGYVQFQLAPPAAVRAGAAWRLVCTNCDTNYSTATNYTLTVASTNAISVQFRPIPGWNLPTNQSVTVQAGQIATPTALYTDVPASLSYNVVEGLRLFGASALTYRIDYKTNLDPQLPWLPLATNTLTTNTVLINGTLPTPGRKFFRAVKTQ